MRRRRRAKIHSFGISHWPCRKMGCAFTGSHHQIGIVFAVNNDIARLTAAIDHIVGDVQQTADQDLVISSTASFTVANGDFDVEAPLASGTMSTFLTRWVVAVHISTVILTVSSDSATCDFATSEMDAFHLDDGRRSRTSCGGQACRRLRNQSCN